jgi:hypothetical protein
MTTAQTQDTPLIDGLGLGTTEPASMLPRTARVRGEPGVQLACRKVLAALDGLDPGAQLRVLRAAALLLGPDAPADA